jgi:hypothetical protein
MVVLLLEISKEQKITMLQANVQTPGNRYECKTLDENLNLKVCSWW